MAEIQSRLKSAADREKWAARGATFVAKAKATKVVWFPPKPVDAGTQAAATATTATRKGARKSTGAAKRSTGAAAKASTGAAKKSAGAAKKSSGAAAKRAADGATKVTSPARGKR